MRYNINLLNSSFHSVTISCVYFYVYHIYTYICVYLHTYLHKWHYNIHVDLQLVLSQNKLKIFCFFLLSKSCIVFLYISVYHYAFNQSLIDSYLFFSFQIFFYKYAHAILYVYLSCNFVEIELLGSRACIICNLIVTLLSKGFFSIFHIYF